MEMNGEITVVALMSARNGHEDQVARELEALLAPTRSESGCLQYDLHRAADDPRTFMFYERWRSQGDLDAHLARPHITSFLERADELLDAPPELTVWQEVG
jgi:quinol monooxygenase YgiN